MDKICEKVLVVFGPRFKGGLRFYYKVVSHVLERWMSGSEIRLEEQMALV